MSRSADCSCPLHQSWTSSLSDGLSAIIQEPLKDHTAALDYVLDYLRQRYSNAIKDEVAAMGHRVVHGKHISRPVLVDEAVLQVIREAADLAPLHNPANLQGIVAATEVFPHCPQVGPPPMLNVLSGCNLQLNMMMHACIGRLRCLTQPSTRACRQHRSCTPYPTSSMRSTPFGSTASTAPLCSTLWSRCLPSSCTFASVLLPCVQQI